MKKDKQKTLIRELIKKRIRKKVATSEFYKSEMPEHFASTIESLKETTILSFILVIILQEMSVPSLKVFLIFSLFLCSFFFWKICQTSLIGWARLNKLHKIIEEEKYEIEYHRPQERKELEMLYSAKGFSGKLLNDVIDVLMADDNRLLQVMMEEEMGLTLRHYEHPLKQGIFAGLGVLIASFFLLFGFFYSRSFYEFFIVGSLVIILSAVFSAKREKNNLSFIIVWNIAILLLISSLTFFAIKIMQML